MAKGPQGVGLDRGCPGQGTEKIGLQETPHLGHGWGTWSRAQCKVRVRNKVTVERKIMCKSPYRVKAHLCLSKQVRAAALISH